MREPRLLSRRPVRQGLLLLAFLLLLYVAVPQVGGLAHAWQAAMGANKVLLCVAVGLLFATYIVGACMYQVLALRPLRFWRTLQVQIAGALAGKLLPAGLGSMGLSARYLQRSRHRAAQVVTVVGTNNVLGFGGYLVVLAFAVMLLHGHWPMMRIHNPMPIVWSAFAGLLLLGVVAVAMYRQKLRQRTRQIVRGLGASLAQYARQPWKPVAALGLATIMPILYTAILYLCVRSVGYALPPAAAFTVFTAGLAAGTATPTPGGVVGAEAGLAAALIAYGFTAEQGLLVALLYRFITYWLPMLPGAFALWTIRRRYL